MQPLWRGLLACAIAGLIPLTMLGNGCQKTTVEPPPVDSGPDTVADMVTDMVMDQAMDQASEGPTAPDTDTDGSVGDAGFDLGGPNGPQVCCAPLGARHCFNDKTLATCTTGGGIPCGTAYGHVWMYQTCAGTCGTPSDDPSAATCR